MEVGDIDVGANVNGNCFYDYIDNNDDEEDNDDYGVEGLL